MRCVFKFFNVYFILQYSRVSGLGDKDAWLVRCSGCCAISCISLRWLEAFSNHHSPDIVMKYWRRTVNRGTCVLRALCSYLPLAPTILLTTNNSVASTFFFSKAVSVHPPSVSLLWNLHEFGLSGFYLARSGPQPRAGFLEIPREFFWNRPPGSRAACTSRYSKVSS